MNQKPVRFAVVSFGVLLLISWFVYGRVAEIDPFSGDNMRILFWANGTAASAVVHADPALYPEWRPLPYFTVWLQYRWLHLSHLHVYFALNALLWTACAWLVCVIVHRLTQSMSAALLAAAVVLIDQRAVVLVIIIEHNATLACFFGLLALLMVLDARAQRLTGARWIGLWLLLLASGLSKEYGLAFAGAIAMSSLVERRRDTATAAIAAAVSYGACRLVFAGGGAAPYCQEMGYFFGLGTVCYDDLYWAVVRHMLYNVVATGVGSFLFGLFDAEGRIGIAPVWVAASAVWLVAAAAGWWKGPSYMRAVLLVVGCNAALSFMLYRDRNQVVAVCALGILIGVGLTSIQLLAQGSGSPRLTRAAVVAACLALLTWEAVATRNIVASEVADSRQFDPCDALVSGLPDDPVFIKHVKVTYGMPDSDCTRGH